MHAAILKAELSQDEAHDRTMDEEMSEDSEEMMKAEELSYLESEEEQEGEEEPFDQLQDKKPESSHSVSCATVSRLNPNISV